MIDGLNDLSSVNVGVWLDQGELSLLAASKLFTGSSIGIVRELELSGVDSDDGAKVKLFKCDAWVCHSFQEDPPVFHVVLKLEN